MLADKINEIIDIINNSDSVISLSQQLAEVKQELTNYEDTVNTDFEQVYTTIESTNANITTMGNYSFVRDTTIKDVINDFWELAEPTDLFNNILLNTDILIQVQSFENSHYGFDEKFLRKYTLFYGTPTPQMPNREFGVNFVFYPVNILSNNIVTIFKFTKSVLISTEELVNVPTFVINFVEGTVQETTTEFKRTAGNSDTYPNAFAVFKRKRVAF